MVDVRTSTRPLSAAEGLAKLATFPFALLTWVDADGMPHQTKIIENNDDTATYLLTSIEKNPALKTSNFQITLPSGTKVQKS